MTNREIIASVRKGINESSADSTYTNKFLYMKIKEQSKWIVVREARSGKLYKGTSIFQTAGCIPIIKVTAATNCCSIPTCCELYRTRYKIDDIWEDINGPIVKSIMSIDGSYNFTFTTPTNWLNKVKNPYNKKNTEQYVFFDSGYFWFPDKAPKKVNISGFYIDDIAGKYVCDKSMLPCTRFLDRKFSVPDYLIAEIVSKVVQELAGITKRMPEDADINKNPNRTN